MNIASFDIGIKNMAYCCLTVDSSFVHVQDWNVIDLINQEQPSYLCNCSIKSKKETKNCEKKAKYKKNDKYFCERHSKTSGYIIPTKKTTLSFIKKQKIDDLLAICKSNFIFFNEKPKKEDIVNKLHNFYNEKCLENIVIKKTLASEIDLIQIGRNMKTIFENKQQMNSCNHIVIENQISPLANRMKTIQGMLAQYFIMIDDSIHIDFVSSSHKLKQFDKLENFKQEKTKSTQNNRNNPNYKENKKDGVFFCKEILNKNTNLNKWLEKMSVSKKDDLADCFLQGLWYFKHKNIISYADDLKIKIV